MKISLINQWMRSFGPAMALEKRDTGLGQVPGPGHTSHLLQSGDLDPLHSSEVVFTSLGSWFDLERALQAFHPFTLKIIKLWASEWDPV